MFQFSLYKSLAVHGADIVVVVVLYKIVSAAQNEIRSAVVSVNI